MAGFGYGIELTAESRRKYGLTPLSRRKRLYSLYAVKTVNGRKRYELISDMAFHKERAVHIFQTQLLAGAFGTGPLAELRPIGKGETAKFRNL